MADITMCKGGECGIKKECYRYTAVPCEHMQAYFTKPPYAKKMGGTACEYFDSNRKYKVVIKC